MQAPRQRTGAGGGDRRKWLLPLVAAGLGFLGLGAVLAFFAFAGDGRSGDERARRVLADAGCTLQTFPAQARTHVAQLPKGYKYNSFPPTSGLHHDTPAPFGDYDEPVEQIHAVHNLEHGGVTIQYGEEIPQSTVDEIVAWYREDPNGIIIAPLPRLGDRIALAAWNAPVAQQGEEEERGRGILAKCGRFDEDAFNAFMDAYAFNGPEPFPKEVLLPGS